MKVAKTIKLFINGDFPRTESGRSLPIYLHKSKTIYANVCKASRKDFRNAVTAALEAQSGWQHKSAYNRSQILYRMAEMMQTKKEEFCEVLTATLGYNKAKAEKSVEEALDTLVHYAGWADKYQQVLGAVNPVSGPHHNFTTTEAVGVVGLLCSEDFNLSNIVEQIAAIILSGNSLVALLPTVGSAILAPLAEVFATSDLPKGVINLLTGEVAELYKHFATHMEVHSLSCQVQDKKILSEIKFASAENMKRITPPSKDTDSLKHIMNYLEFKTVWHPIGV